MGVTTTTTTMATMKPRDFHGAKAFCRHGIRAEWAAVMTLPQTLLFILKNIYIYKKARC